MTTNGSTSTVVTGLQRDQTYEFAVVATNAIGDSGSSATKGTVTTPPEDPVEPTGAPSAPQNLTFSKGDGSVTLFWTEPESHNPPITGYTVSGSPGITIRPLSPDARSTTFTGLANHTTYTFYVTATNSQGEGPQSSTGPITPVGPITGTATAFAKFYLEDPAQIDVTSVRSELYWTYDGICARENFRGSSTTDYYQQTGWTQASFTSQQTQDCSGAKASASAHFDNNLFCYTVTQGSVDEPTAVEYQNVSLNGNRDGTFTWTLTDETPTITGGCGSWLNPEVEHGYLSDPS